MRTLLQYFRKVIQDTKDDISIDKYAWIRRQIVYDALSISTRYARITI